MLVRLHTTKARISLLSKLPLQSKRRTIKTTGANTDIETAAHGRQQRSSHGAKAALEDEEGLVEILEVEEGPRVPHCQMVRSRGSQ